MFHLCAKFAIVITLAGIYCEEPQCSKFHYEAQTLEKMIRMEIKVEAMEKEITKTSQLVLESLQALKTEREDLTKDYAIVKKTILDENDRLKTDYADLERRILEANETLLKNNADLKEKLLADSKSINDELLTPTIAFKARSPSHKMFSSGQTVIFTTIMMNEGGAYDNTNGIFTAPIAGTYLFTVQLCLHSGQHFYYGILAENVVQTSGKFYESTSDSCHSADAILVLRPGQTLVVKCLVGYSYDLLYDTAFEPPNWNNWNTFSGVLINK